MSQFLKTFFMSIFVLTVSTTIAISKPDNSLYDGPTKETFKKDEKEFSTCKSTEEYKLALNFLSKETDLSLSESSQVVHALEISKGCNGAAERFIELYLLLTKSGVDLGESFKLAKIFSQLESERALAFKEIFKKAFLENYLNLDFKNAFHLSLALSKDYKGNPENIKNDFVQLTEFCTDEKSMSLSYKACTELIIQVTESTVMYKNGVFADFKRLYEFLRTNKRLGLSVQSSLKIVPQVLKNGPKAVDNFLNGFTYAVSEAPVKLSEQQALKLALSLSDYSYQENKDQIKK
jgi:hypothetical protein